MQTKTRRLMLQGGFVFLGALVWASFGVWPRRATAADQPAPVTAPPLPGELRAWRQRL